MKLRKITVRVTLPLGHLDRKIKKLLPIWLFRNEIVLKRLNLFYAALLSHQIFGTVIFDK